MRLSYRLLLLLAMPVIASCGGTTVPAGQDSSEFVVTSVSPAMTPTAGQALDSALPTPSSALETQMGDGASVRGTLVLFDPVNLAPEDDGIFLVSIDRSVDEGVALAMPGIDDTAIRATVDEANGDFVFRGIATGFYALVVRTDRGQQVSVRDAETQTTTFVDVLPEHEGTLIDLGQQRIP